MISQMNAEFFYGLGHGSVAKDAGVAADSVSFPLVVISHGASGSAPNYGWLTEYLARKGMIVLGVSHYGESWRYGPDAVDPSAVTRLWTRPQDCTFALSQILQERLFKGRVDPTRIAAIGHSSGGRHRDRSRRSHLRSSCAACLLSIGNCQKRPGMSVR